MTWMRLRLEGIDALGVLLLFCWLRNIRSLFFRFYGCHFRCAGISTEPAERRVTTYNFQTLSQQSNSARKRGRLW